MRRFEQVREEAMQYNKNPIKKPAGLQTGFYF